MDRSIGSGVIWLATASGGALYGRFLPSSTLTSAVTGALVALVVIYLWAHVSRV